MTLDQLVFATVDSAFELEVAVSIPYTSLSFVRAGGAYLARYRVTAKVLDGRGELVAGDYWIITASTASYDASSSRDSASLAVFSLRLPESAQRASVDVEDMESDRTARSTFELVRPAGRAVIRLLRSGRISVGAVYGLGDTVEVAVRIPGWVADSVEFVVGLSGRPPATLRTQARDSAGVGVAVLAVPVADSVGRPRLKSGLYRVTARPAPDSGQTWSASAGFEVRLPFYHDDSAYFERVEQLAYVATVEQIRWLRAVPPAARDTAWGTFWKPMDPSPATPENEREREYFERIDYATEHFGRPDRGFRSDRARVYVKFGPPDQVESKPFEIDRPARETWYYYERGLAVSFVDRFGWGEFLLEAPREPDEQ